MEQGPTEKLIVEQCARQRIPLPARIANSPEVLFGLAVFYVAFLDLTSCRGTGYGTEGPISWLAIHQYADAKELDDEQREDLFYFIGKLDVVYLDYKTRKLKEGATPSLIASDGSKLKR